MRDLTTLTSTLHRQAGYLMLEVLVAIVIVAFGLMGLAALQTKIAVSETEAFQRVQALLLVEDMVNRVSANRANAAAFVTGGPLGTGDSQPASCSTLAGVALDLCEWSQALKGAAEKEAGSSVFIGAMVGARGCIELIGGSNPPVYRVSVSWQGLSKLRPPTLTCGQNLYGEEAYRRTIAGFVPIANLIN